MKFYRLWGKNFFYLIYEKKDKFLKAFYRYEYILLECELRLFLLRLKGIKGRE